jgi:hypothetical protein
MHNVIITLAILKADYPTECISCFGGHFCLLLSDLEYRDSKFVRNVGKFLSSFALSHSRRHTLQIIFVITLNLAYY